MYGIVLPIRIVIIVVILYSLFYYLFTLAQRPIDRLRDVVTNDVEITDIWAYKDTFPNLNSLNTSIESINAGISVDGVRSRQGIKKMLASALKGKNVNLFVLGGSVTLGGDLGKDNTRLTFHYALADWWNKTIGSVTGGYMTRKIVAVGGVGTTYFGHCWQEYVTEGDSYDFVTWEFAINDPDSLQYDKAVERFARDILSLQTKPGLIFVNFVSKSALKKTKDSCKKHEAEAKTVDFIADTYSSTSLRWERILCHERKHNNHIDVEKLFIEHHPNLIGHAQMAYMLINYFKTVILEVISLQKNSDDNSYSDQMPKAVFLAHDEIYTVSQCYSSIKPDPLNPPKHQLKELTILENNGFTVKPDTQWSDVPELRSDSTGGYIATLSNKKLKLEFRIPNSINKIPLRITVTIRRQPFGGKIKFILDEGTGNELTVFTDSSDKVKAGTHSEELGKLTQGLHTLTIYTITGGCNMCALIFD